MNKLITTLCVVLVTTGAVMAQSGKLIKADELYHGFSYVKAIEKYEALEDLPSDSKRNLADCYKRVGKYDKAEGVYGELARAKDATAYDIYFYSVVLRSNGKYEESNWMMEMFHEKLQTDTRGIEHMENYGLLPELLRDKGHYIIRNIAANTDHQDFGPAYYKNQIVFASTRQSGTPKPIERKWNGNQLPFLDMYLADKDSSGELSNLVPFHKTLSHKFHEGPATFSKDGGHIIYTRNNYTGTSSDGVVKLQLYEANVTDVSWSKPKPLHFNSSEYSVGHPSLSEDGKTLYFTSDMPGGIGGTDIYMVAKVDTGWGTPVNLGPKVNTEGAEMFPFVHRDGYLFFASDGHTGLGGLDIFISPLKGEEVTTPVNVGFPINSKTDDFSLIIDDPMKQGYFSSNRPGGKGDDDIYAFDLVKAFRFDANISGIAEDKDGNQLAQVTVQLFDEDGLLLQETTTDSEGEYSFTVSQDAKTYQLKGTKADYFDGTNTATIEDGDDALSDLQLEKDPGLSLYCLITEKDSLAPIPDVKIKLVNNITGAEQDLTTAATGDFRKPLKDNKLNDRISYNLTLEKEGFMSKTVTYNKALETAGQYNMHEEMDFSLTKIGVGMDLSKMIDIKPIFFDVNKSNIRKDAAVELDKIVKVMNENPTLEIELGSHTDCRASAKYNESLSDRRAKASAQYVKDHITNPDRIFGKGYGESHLVNECECEGKVKVACSEEQHQANRRTEFKITKM